MSLSERGKRKSSESAEPEQAEKKPNKDVSSVSSENKTESKKSGGSLLSSKAAGPESEYNPASGTSYQPVDDACWKQGEK